MKKTVYLTMAAVVCAAALTGCQKAPDVAESNGILHAQGDMERQVQDIAASDDRGQTQTENSSEFQERLLAEIVEEFMNIHISTNMIFTVVIFLTVYGSYFLATCLSCKRMVTEHQNKRMEE